MPKDQKTQRYSCHRTVDSSTHRSIRSVSQRLVPTGSAKQGLFSRAMLDGNLRLRPTNQTCSHATAQNFRSNIGPAQRTIPATIIRTSRPTKPMISPLSMPATIAMSYSSNGVVTSQSM